MKKFLKDSLRYFIGFIITTYGAALLILIFAMLAVTYWEEYAWGTTATFAVFVFVALGFYHFRSKKKR